MNAETLNIKLKLELGSLMNDVKKVKAQLGNMASTVKNSIPKISTESKKAKDALGGVTKASKDVRKAIDGIGDEAKNSLSTITSQSNKATQALKSIGIAGKDAQTGLNADGVAESTDGATASLEEMQGTMQMIMGMDFFDLLISNWDKIKGVFTDTGARIKEAVQFTKAFGAEWRKSVTDLKQGTQSVSNIAKKFKELVKEGKLNTNQQKKFNNLLKEARKVNFNFAKDVAKLTGKAIANVTKDLAAMVIKIGSVAAAFAAVATAVGAIALAINAIGISKLGEEIYNGAQRAGMSAQKYQEWSYILERAGIEASELTEIVKTLTEAQIDVLDGTEDMTNAFAKLGMSASDVAGMGQDELWERTIAALQNVENATERTAIAYKIFGEDAAKLTTVLNLSNADTQKLIGTYNQLNGAMSKELITNSVVLQNSLGNLRVAWQGLRNTLAQWVIPAVISVVNWIAKAIVAVNVFLQKFFNIDLTPATDSMAGGITGATGAMGGYEDAVKGATTAVEKLKRTTMGFDELNIVSNPNTDTGATGGGGAGGGAGAGMGALGSSANSIFTDASKQVEEFEKKVSDFMDKWGWAIKGIGIALGALSIRHLLIQLASAIGLGESLKAALSFKGIASGISSLVGWLGAFIGLLKEGYSFTAVLGAAFPKLAAGFTSIGSAASGALAAIGGIFGGGVAAGAAVVIAVIAAVAGVVVYLKRNWDDVTAAVKRFFDENIKPKLDSIKKSLSELIPPVVLEKLKKLWQGVKDVVKAIADWFASIKWIEAIGDVFEVIGEVVFNVLAGTIAGAIEAVLGWIDGLLKAITGVKDIISGVIGAIIAIFKGDLPKAKQEIVKIFDGIKKYFSGWYDMTLGIVVNFVKGVGDWFAKLYPKFETVWNKIKNLFSKVGTAISDAVVGSVKSAINAVLRTVTNKINTFIGWINGAVGVINKIPGVNIGKITKLSVPQLAKGGIVTSETLARIGEGGRKEAVLPLEQNTGWMDTLAAKIRGGNDRPIHVHVDVDGNELGWAVIHSINNITRQTGGLQLAL